MTRALLTAAQLSRMQAMVTEYLPTDVTVSILRQHAPRVVSGVVVENWQAAATGIPALITPYVPRGHGGQTVMESHFVPPLVWKISLPALTDVLMADRITTSDRAFDVTAVAAAESLEILREVLCVERLPG